VITTCPTCGAPSYELPSRLAERRARMYQAAHHEPRALPCPVHLWERIVAACGPDPNDGLADFRAEATPEERAACPHPPDDRVPLSGDGWLCGICGDDCESPIMVPEGVS